MTTSAMPQTRPPSAAASNQQMTASQHQTAAIGTGVPHHRRSGWVIAVVVLVAILIIVVVVVVVVTSRKPEASVSGACGNKTCGTPNGSGVVVGNVATCQCINGYSGAACEVPAPASCAGLNCGANGNCQALADRAVCVCRNNYTGTTCTNPPAPTVAVCSSGHPNGTCTCTDESCDGGVCKPKIRCSDFLCSLVFVAWPQIGTCLQKGDPGNDENAKRAKRDALEWYQKSSVTLAAVHTKYCADFTNQAGYWKWYNDTFSPPAYTAMAGLGLAVFCPNIITHRS